MDLFSLPRLLNGSSQSKQASASIGEFADTKGSCRCISLAEGESISAWELWAGLFLTEREAVVKPSGNEPSLYLHDGVTNLTP